MLKHTILVAAVAGMVLGLVAGPAGATLISVTAYTGSNNQDNYGGNMSDLFSGEEITKTDPSDPSTWTADGGDHYSHEWQAGALQSGAVNNKIAWTAFDFGATVANLDDIYFWNIRQDSGQDARTILYNIYYCTGSPTVALPAAPTDDSTVDYDFSSPGWTLLNTGGTLTMPQKGGAPDPANQIISLGGISARYIAVEILTNAGSTSRAGLSEIAIVQIPEPATLALLGLGGLGLILGRKRR